MKLFKFITTLSIVETTGGGSATIAAEKDIIDIASSAGSFNTLVVAIKKAGLVETLKGKGPFTVFAPNDEAFAKIPQAQLDSILADNALLTKILTYHVVAGKVMAADVKAGEVQTVQGDNITITLSNDNVLVDEAHVITTDIEASNGVIHVIDSVMIPQ